MKMVSGKGGILVVLGLWCWVAWAGGAAGAGAGYDTSVSHYWFLRAEKVAVLSSAVDGLVVEVAREPQDFVSQGDRLVQLDAELIRLERDKTKAQIDLNTRHEEARINLAYFTANLKVIQDLYDTLVHEVRVGSPKELQEAKQRKELAGLEQRKAELELRQLQLTLAQLEKRLELHAIRAPMDGVIVPFSSVASLEQRNLKEVAVGEVVAPGQPLMALIKVDRLRVSYPLGVEMLEAVALGDEALVYVEGADDTGIPGQVVYKSPTLDSTGQFYVEVEFTNPEVPFEGKGRGYYRYRFRPGMRAQVVLEGDEPVESLDGETLD